MNYKLIKKEQNIGGDWSVAIEVNETTLHLLFPSDPTESTLTGAAQNFIDFPPEELEEVE
mgnify:FL=1